MESKDCYNKPKYNPDRIMFDSYDEGDVEDRYIDLLIDQLHDMAEQLND